MIEISYEVLLSGLEKRGRSWL